MTLRHDCALNILYIYSHTLTCFVRLQPYLACFTMEANNLELIKKPSLLGYDNLCCKLDAIISFIPSNPKHFKQTTVEYGTSIHSISKGMLSQLALLENLLLFAAATRGLET